MTPEELPPLHLPFHCEEYPQPDAHNARKELRRSKRFATPLARLTENKKFLTTVRKGNRLVRNKKNIKSMKVAFV
jgi:hypothetical protein